jgi:hypothetical protein
MRTKAFAHSWKSENRSGSGNDDVGREVGTEVKIEVKIEAKVEMMSFRTGPEERWGTCFSWLLGL